MSEMTRRDMLQRSGLGLAVGLTATSAGCLDSVSSVGSDSSPTPGNGGSPTPGNGGSPTPGNGGSPTPGNGGSSLSESGSSSTPMSSPPPYTEWLSIPSGSSQAGSDDSLIPPYSLTVVDRQSFRQHRFSDALNYSGVSNRSDIQTNATKKYIEYGIYQTHYITVESGSYDKSAVVSSFYDNGYTDNGSAHGYTLLTDHVEVGKGHASTSTIKRAGVSNTNVILSIGVLGNTPPSITDIINTKQNPMKRYVVRNKALATLTKHLGVGDYVWLGESTFEFLEGFSGKGIEYPADGYQLGGNIQLNDEISHFTIAFLNYRQNPLNKPSIEPILRSKLQDALGVNKSLKIWWTDDLLQAKMEVPTEAIISKL